MAIDISCEQLLTLAEAAAMLPGHPSICTIWRWRTRGARGRVLESVVLGGKVYTSVEALQRFAAHTGGSSPQPSRTTRQRERAMARAEAELDRRGI